MQLITAAAIVSSETHACSVRGSVVPSMYQKSVLLWWFSKIIIKHHLNGHWGEGVTFHSQCTCTGYSEYMYSYLGLVAGGYYTLKQKPYMSTLSFQWEISDLKGLLATCLTISHALNDLSKVCLCCWYCQM